MEPAGEPTFTLRCTTPAKPKNNMSKDHNKHEHKGEGLRLVGNPEKMINLLLSSPVEKEWVTDEINNHGPKHKQVLTALMLRRLLKLVQRVEQTTGTKFTAQEGCKLFVTKKDEELLLPIRLPVHKGINTDVQGVVDAIAHAPEHEALAFAMYLQVVEWAIETLGKKKA